jgi:hypothetical protein
VTAVALTHAQFSNDAPSGWVGGELDALPLWHRAMCLVALSYLRTQELRGPITFTTIAWADQCRQLDMTGGEVRVEWTSLEGRQARLRRARTALYLRELLRRDEEIRAELSDFFGTSWGRDTLRLWPDRDLWAPSACPSCGWTRAEELRLSETLRVDPTLENRPYEEVLARMPMKWRMCKHPQGLFWTRRRALWELAPPTRGL